MLQVCVTLSRWLCDARMHREHSADAAANSPGSPPGMTTSKSSKSSSFQSLSSEDGSVLADIGHFEDIGLDDDNATLKAAARPTARRPSPSPSPSPSPAVSPHLASSRTLSARPAPRPRRSFPNLHVNGHSSNPRSTSLAVLTDPRPITQPKGYSASHSTTSLPISRRRSPSPGLSLNPRGPSLPPKPRRGSSQGRRRSFAELESTFDEDEGDDIPDGFILDNVPISPRPPSDRPPSRGPSPTPDPTPKERVRSVGNGTPAIAQAQGSLRSPAWKQDGPGTPGVRPQLKARAQSWNIAHAELNAEARALTEKLEEHADEVEEKFTKPSGSGRPNTWNASRRSVDNLYDKKERVRSTPELPPLRRTNIMIDPLPVSKEKEAVLSRTRPSWLPPKDPAEERRHLREYQKMVTASAKADERREAARRVKVESKDSVAENAMHIWENDIVPRWGDSIRERRTRELWWKGVPPRSRGLVWTRAIGNVLGLSGASFQAALGRAQQLEERVRTNRADSEDVRRAAWLTQIRKDAAENTLQDLRIFQVGGPLHDSLVDVLSAYAMYRSDIGYVSGCNVSVMRLYSHIS